MLNVDFKLNSTQLLLLNIKSINMKQLLFLLFFIISFGLQVAHAEFLNLGAAEIIMLLVAGFFAATFVIGFIFLCLYLIRSVKPAKNEK